MVASSGVTCAEKHTDTTSYDTVRCMCSALVGGLLFAARAALLACVGGLAFLIRLCLRWFPALVSDCPGMPNHHVSLYTSLDCAT